MWVSANNAPLCKQSRKIIIRSNRYTGLSLTHSAYVQEDPIIWVTVSLSPAHPYRSGIGDVPEYCIGKTALECRRSVI